jgi:uncharacterized protein (DUF2336 family)
MSATPSASPTDLAQSESLPTRSALVRVLTDLFAVRPHHTPDEIRHYEEIMLRMARDAEPRVILEAARKLAPHPQAPLAVLQALIDIDPDCACLILARSPVVTDDMLTSAAQFGTGDQAAAVAMRKPLGADLVSILVTRPEDEVWRALAQNETAVLDASALRELARRGREDETIATSVCSRTDDPTILLPLFLAASSKQRASIILEAERETLIAGVRGAPDRHDPSICEALDQAAIARDFPEFRARLAAALRCDVGLVRRILADSTGEPLAMALVSLGMPIEAIMRVFLLGHEAIAHDCDKIEMLHRLVRQTSFAAAQRITGAMLGAPMAEPARAHRPLMDQTAKSVPSRPAAHETQAATAQPRKLPLFLFRKKLR